MLFTSSYQFLIPPGNNSVFDRWPSVGLTLRRGPGDLNNANTPDDGARENSFSELVAK